MSEKNKLSEDYISLSGFERGLKHFLHSFFRFLSYLQFVLVKSIYYVLIGLAVGLLLGYFYYKSRPQLYKISMVVEYNEFTKRTYAEMIYQLNRITGPGSVKDLANKLKVPDETAAKIAYFDSKDMNDDPLKNDTSTRRFQHFKIQAGIVDNTISDTLETAIVNYLNNSPQLKKVKREQRKIFTEKLSFINSELQKLDSLKLEYNRFLGRPNVATFYNNAFNPAEIYEQSNTLANQKEVVTRWLTVDSSAVNIVDGFKVAASPQVISLLNSLLIFGGVGFLLGYLVGFTRETKKKVS